MQNALLSCKSFIICMIEQWTISGGHIRGHKYKDVAGSARMPTKIDSK